MAFTPYITREELKDWAQVPGDAKGLVIDEALAATTRAIDEYCGRHFWQDGTTGTPVARTFRPCDPHRLDLGEFNDLTDLVAPTVESDEAGDGVFEALWASSDFELLPASRPTGRPYTAIVAVGGRQFPIPTSVGRRERVRVTGVWGWPANPPPVKLACRVRATQLLTRMQSPNGVAGVGDFGPIRADRPEDRDVVALLNPYRLSPLLVA